MTEPQQQSMHDHAQTKHAHPQRPVRNINMEHQQALHCAERLALAITQRVGTMGFFLAILSWTILWLGWNLLAPPHLQFDPPTAFVFWLFISNMIQILLMPLIMVGQNLQGRHAELRAENDYEINLKAEYEIKTLLARLDQQDRLLQAMARQLNVDTEALTTTQS